MQLEYSLNSALPPLAWAAMVHPSRAECRVLHGSLVETHPTFFIEGAWAGEFAQGDLTATEVFFGSGGTPVGESMVFVASLATTDCVYYCSINDGTVVGNSLALVLAMCGERLDPCYKGYAGINNSMLAGIDGYARSLPTKKGEIRRLLHGNLQVGVEGVRELSKPEPPAFATFADYASYLAESYAAMVANARDARRARPLRIFSTQSRGYDSTAINAVAARHGLDGVFTVRTGKGGGSTASNPREREVDDDGTEIAHALRIERVIGLERRAFVHGFEDEVYFHATVHECQDANLKEIALHIEAPALLLTGTLGEMWYTRDPWYNDHPGLITPTLKRVDLGGHGLTEVRLRAGYVQVSVPFIGARRRAEIVAITESAEMAPWRLNTAYDRPIPRRLAEEAGVQREAFGMTKVGSVVEFAIPQYPQDRSLRQKYSGFLKENGLLKPWQIPLYPIVQRINEVTWFASPHCHRAVYYAVRVLSKIARREIRAPILWERLRGSLFCFAVNECVREYESVLAAT